MSPTATHERVTGSNGTQAEGVVVEPAVITLRNGRSESQDGKQTRNEHLSNHVAWGSVRGEIEVVDDLVKGSDMLKYLSGWSVLYRTAWLQSWRTDRAKTMQGCSHRTDGQWYGLDVKRDARSKHVPQSWYMDIRVVGCTEVRSRGPSWARVPRQRRPQVVALLQLTDQRVFGHRITEAATRVGARAAKDRPSLDVLSVWVSWPQVSCPEGRVERWRGDECMLESVREERLSRRDVDL